MATCPHIRPDNFPLGERPIRPEPSNLTLFPTAARHGYGESDSEASTPTPGPDRRTKPASELVGIARLAASSPLSDARRGTEYFVLPVRSILNRCDSERVPFEWTINPYRGCEFGCHYCYARYTHEFMELPVDEFETKIYAKENAGPLIERDLAKRYREPSPMEGPDAEPEHIAIGTATDPYQPAEREFGATRAILEKLADREGMSLSITTKSDQVLRDLDLLKRISEHSSIMVNLSITTVRTHLARLLEPRAPRPDLRLGAVRALRAAGISAGVLAMPVLPWLTDSENDLDALAHAAADAGAQWFAARVLHLMPSTQKHFMPFVAQKFPRLVSQYQSWYGRAANAPEKYRRTISTRVERLRQKYNLGQRPPRGGHVRKPAQMQFTLGGVTEPCHA